MSSSGTSVADMIKTTYKQIPKDKCVAGGGKHVNLVMDSTVGYCLCPEGQAIADSANPKCAPIDAKTTYDPFSSGFYRDGTACNKDEGLVTQKHPWHQNFGEPACVSPAPSCLPGFEKQQLRYDGEVLDYCVRKDENGNFVSSYYPTTFLIRPPEPTPVPVAPTPPPEERGFPQWVWYLIGGVVGVILIAMLAFAGYKTLYHSDKPTSPGVTPKPLSPLIPALPDAPSTSTSFSMSARAPTAAVEPPKVVGGKGKSKGMGWGRVRGKK